MRARSPEEALAHAEEVTELVVGTAWSTPWQEVVPALPRLTSLVLSAAARPDPSPVRSWPRGLRRLEMKLGPAEPDLRPWVEAIPDLEALIVDLGESGRRALPEAVGDWPALWSLSVKASGSLELPDRLIGGSVRDLSLTLGVDSLPSSVTQLTQLEALTLRQPLRALPPELATLERLRRLDLAGSLNGGTLDADEGRPSDFQPLPAVVSELASLEALNVDRCGIFERDVARLAGHPRLAGLSLGWAGLRDLSGVRDLPALRELATPSCYELRDITPLRGLGLEVLDLSRCPVRDLTPVRDLPRLRRLNIRGCRRASLTPVLTHPALEELIGDDAQLAKWGRRGELAEVSPQALRSRVTSEDPSLRASGLRGLVSWVELTSGERPNALLDVFTPLPSGPDAGSPTELPELSAALSDPELDVGLAVKVFGVLFRRFSDNLTPALEAAQVVLLRGDDLDQVALVDAVLRARASYEAGHREFGPGVHDALLDDVLPRLRCPALTHLLCELSDDALQGDELEDLFVPAYAHADPSLLARLDARLSRYAGRPGDAHVADLLGRVAAVDPAVFDRLPQLASPPAPLRAQHARAPSQAPGVATPPPQTEPAPATPLPVAPRSRTWEEELDRRLRDPRADLLGHLQHPDGAASRVQMSRDRSRALARWLDAEHRRGGEAGQIPAVMATLLHLRPRWRWAAEDLQYVLTYLMPAAAARGPAFFAEHVAPWLDGPVTEPRLAFNLACYQAQHGDTDALRAAIARALALGRSPEDFLGDADFAARLPEVQSLLS